MKYLCLLLIIFFIKISAQTEIKGKVRFSQKDINFTANIILLNQNNEIETFGFTDKTGSFSVYTEKIGDFKLQIKAFNYLSKEINIKISDKNQLIDTGEIFIEKLDETEIKVVVITKTNAIKIKKDTIEFNVQNFSSGTELNVEELLKKLPGIKIDSEGKIKFGDKDVERVMVENDDLFERGYQTLTQNMPTKPLDKVQVLKNYSKNKLLKGIENSEGIAINLTLKEDAKSQWFGSALLASTSYKEKMHQAKLNLMNFSKRKKIYVLFNYNNIGLDEMKGVDYLIRPSSDKDIENVGSSINTLSIVNLHAKNVQFEDKRTNFNNDKLATINYINNFERDWKLKLVTIFNQTENQNFIDSYYKYNFQNINFQNSENKSWKQNRQNIVAKFEAVKEYKNSSLLIYNKLSQIDENNDNLFLFNSITNLQEGTNKLFSSENRLVFTKKIDSSRAFVLVAKYIGQSRPYTFLTENNVFQNISNLQDAAKGLQNIDSRMNFGGFKLSYLKSWGENKKIEFQAGNEYKSDDLNSDIALYNVNNELLDFNDSNFSNNINFFQNTIFSQLKFSNRKDKWNYNFALLTQYIGSNLNKQENKGVYISPAFEIGYQNRETGNFNFIASRKFSSTGITDFITGYIYQGNRSFKQSNVGAQQLADYNFNFTYNLGDMLSEYLNLNLAFFKDEDYLSNNMIINQNYTLNQSILIKNKVTFSANLELRKYLKFLKSRISLLNSYFHSDYENSINNNPFTKTEFSNFKTGFELKSGWIKKVNYEAGYEWTFNKISSEINQSKYVDQKGYFNFYYNVNPSFRVEANLEKFKYGNTTQKGTTFLDVKLNYLLKDLKLNLFLIGSNLLNNNEIQRYSISNVSESLYTQRLIPRNILLGINKTF